MTPDQKTQQQTPGAAPAAPFAAMLRATLVPLAVAAPVIILAFWVTRGTRGGLAALLGVVIAAVFFAGGLHVMARVTNVNPISVLVGALAVYLGQVLFLGVVIFFLTGAAWLDGKAFGLSVLAIALIWQVVQVVAFVRLRKPVYDLPAGTPADVSAHAPAETPPDSLASKASAETADGPAR